MSAAAIGVVGLMLCSSSSAAAMFMMGGDEEPKVGPTLAPAAPVPPPPKPPAAPVPPPPKPPVVVDVPATFRTSTAPWGKPNGGRDVMKAHNNGRLDADLWAADVNEIGKWYQMDNGKIADIVGVAIMGRKTGADQPWGPQYVKTFKVKYYDAGTWKDVDGGAIFTGNTDHDTKVEVKFAAPVKTRYIRIYPQTWNKHMSLRAGLITNSTLKESELKLLNIPAEKRAASSWWNNNDDPNWHPNRGTLNSGTGWHPRGNTPADGSEWYELQMDSPTKVAGVALQGRGDANDPNVAWVWQWITTFTAKYKDSTGTWKDVDNGFVYSGCSDKDSIVWAPFNTPVSTTAIRIYPKTWDGWFSGRFDLLGSTGSSSESYTIGGGNQEITGFSF